jgi:hypothetical protein
MWMPPGNIPDASDTEDDQIRTRTVIRHPGPANGPPAPVLGFARPIGRVKIPALFLHPGFDEHSMSQVQQYEVIVIGGGHAGIEAAPAEFVPGTQGP